MSDQNVPKLLSEREAEDLTGPHKDKLRQCFRKAVEDWQKLYTPVHHILSPRAQAAIIHDHIVYHATELFHGLSGIEIGKRRGIFTVHLESAADLRFKKLDKRGRSSNVKTKQAMRYQAQLRLPGFEDLTRLIAGYQLDPLSYDLRGMFVTLQVGSTVKYRIDLREEASAQGVITMQQPVPQIPASRKAIRIRLKKEAEADANTKDGQS